MVQLSLRGMGHRRFVPVLHPQQANGLQAVFLRFLRPRGKGRSRPPRRGRRGPAPAKASAPARGAGRARGARTICTNQSPEKQQGQHRAPGKHRPRSRAANFEGLAPGRGRGGRPLGGHSMPRLPRTGGLGGRPCGATLPERRGSRATGPGAREASRERSAPDQRRASAPPRGRGRRRRGAARLMPGVVVQRGAVAPSAARRPGGRLLMRCRASSLRIILR